MHPDYDPGDIDVHIVELLVATSDEADPLLHPKVGEALRLLRTTMDMDVVFVSQFTGGRREFRAVESAAPEPIAPGMSDPLERSWCQYVVDGRLPELMLDAAPFIESGAAPATGIAIGTHLSTPVVLQGGEVYGTLCCFSHQVRPRASQRDLNRLREIARVLARHLA